MQQGNETMEGGKKRESEREIQPQLYPLGLVAMATEAFSAERGTNIRKSVRDTHRDREREITWRMRDAAMMRVNADK